MFYILDANHKIVSVGNDVVRWGEFFSDINKRRVAYDEIGDIQISTVFLGVDHPGGLFETMIFRDDGKGDECWRCATWKEALAQHEEAIHTLQQLAIDKN